MGSGSSVTPKEELLILNSSNPKKVRRDKAMVTAFNCSDIECSLYRLCCKSVNTRVMALSIYENADKEISSIESRCKKYLRTGRNHMRCLNYKKAEEFFLYAYEVRY
jgi:hypothetical protein